MESNSQIISIELDVPPDQIVHWIREEVDKRRSTFTICATREYMIDEDADLQKAELSPESDTASMITNGLLEIRPAGTENGWLLQVQIEDVLGPHTPEDESVPEGPQEIDLETFESEFVKPDQGTAFVTVQAKTAKSKKQFDQMFAEILRDRHTN